MLKIIFGTEKADFKFVRIDDKRLRTVADSRERLRYLPQHSFLPKDVTVKRLIRIFCGPGNEVKLLHDPVIQSIANDKAGHLSAGQRRWLEVALIIHSQAQFVLLDEPFNGLAPLARGQISAMIREQSHQKGFIITDHAYHHVLDLSTRLILLRDGGIRVVPDRAALMAGGYLPKNI